MPVSFQSLLMAIGTEGMQLGAFFYIFSFALLKWFGATAGTPLGTLIHPNGLRECLHTFAFNTIIIHVGFLEEEG